MCVAVRWVDIGNCQGGYVTGWVNQSGHVTGCVYMMAVRWLQENDKQMVRYWLRQETGWVMVMHYPTCPGTWLRMNILLISAGRS